MYRLLDANHVAAALFMLFVLAPLAYAGGLMTLHPAKFIALLNRLMSAVNTIEAQFLWRLQRRPFPDPAPFRDSRLTHVVVRLAGLLIALTGLVHLAEAASWLVAK